MGRADPNHSKTSPYTCCYQKQKIASVGKDVEKREPFCILVGKVKWCSCCAKQCGGSSKKQSITTIQSSNPTSEYISKKIEVRVLKKYLHLIFIVAFFTVAKMGGDYMFIDTWINKENVYIYMYICINISLLKKGNPFIYDNMAKSRGHDAKWTKAVTGQRLHDSTHMRCLKQSDS